MISKLRSMTLESTIEAKAINMFRINLKWIMRVTA
jgi:hypothetical protein